MSEQQQYLREAKQAIRFFIRAHWSDQKLAEVLAFNADGKMGFWAPCNCILGVTLSDKLHAGEQCPDSVARHYARAIYLTGADEAEGGYAYLGIAGDRRARFSAILRAELRRRDRARRAEAESLDRELSLLLTADGGRTVRRDGSDALAIAENLEAVRIG